MTTASFQAVFNKKLKFNNELIDILKRSSEENYGQKTNKELEGFVTIRYQLEIVNKKYLLGFSVDFRDVETDLETAIQTYCRLLQEHDNCEITIKYQDDNLLETLRDLYYEIFDIEMNLREIISLIFITTYENDYFNFLDIQKIKPIIKGQKKQDIPDFFRSRFQNEFFFLTFNQYKNLEIPDIVKSSTLISLLSNKQKSNTFKKAILKLGIFKESKSKYVDFLNSIGEDMESIEDIRNCVAHNREPSEEEIESYEKAKEKLKQKMSDFMLNNVKDKG